MQNLVPRKGFKGRNFSRIMGIQMKIQIVENKDLTKNQKKTINKARVAEWGIEEKKRISKDYEPETLWFFVKKNRTVVSLGAIRPLEIDYMSKTYSIGGICSVISIVKNKGYGSMLIAGMIKYSKDSGKTILGFTMQKEFFKLAGLKTEEEFIQKFIYMKPSGEQIYDSRGDGIYYQGKDKFISKVIKSSKPVYIGVPHW